MYTVYGWWKRDPNAGGGARHQQMYLEVETEDEAQRRALDLVERLDAHYATYWEDNQDGAGADPSLHL